MERNYFYTQTEKMIRKESDLIELGKIRNYILRSRQTASVQIPLLDLVAAKEGIIKGIPQFRCINGEMILLSEDCHVHIITTKIGAIWKKLMLSMRGYKVEIINTGPTYRIKKKKPQQAIS